MTGREVEKSRSRDVGEVFSTPRPLDSSTKVTLTFTEISDRLHAAKLPEVDVVVGIARGGLHPALMVAHQLRVPLAVMRVNFRDDDNKPRSDVPKLLQPHDAELTGKRVLLVDDVSVSGATLRFAAALLSDAAHITTLTLKGQAEIVLFPEVKACVNWPWHAQNVPAQSS